MKTQVGWADLVRTLRTVGAADIDALATPLGFERRPPAVPVVAPPPDEAVGDEVAAAATITHVPIPFWHAESFDVLERVPLSSEPPQRRHVAPRPRSTALPKTPSLVPRAELAGHLERARHGFGPGGIDLVRLVAELARGRAPATLPRRLRRLARGRVWVLLDRSRRLVPIWSDQVDVLEALQHKTGDDGLRWSALEWGPHPPPGGDELHLPAPFHGGSEAVPVLLLSDLGTYGTKADRSAWLALGRRLARRGHPLYALLPAPRRRWSGTAPTLWRARVWDRRVAATVGAPDERVADMLRLLAPALRIEPGLLRAARLALLPADRADVGTEIDAWRSRHVETRWTSWMQLAPDAASTWRDEWSRLPPDQRALPPDLRKRAAALIDRWHDAAPAEVGHIETAIVEALAPGTVEPERVEAMRDFLATLRDPATDAPQGVEAWLRGVRASVPDVTWNAPKFGDELTRTWLRHCADLDQASAPPSASEADRIDAASPGEPRSWAVLQRGSYLEVAPFDDTDGRKPLPPSQLLVLRTGYDHIAWGREGSMSRARLEPGVRLRLPESIERLVVEVPEGRWRLGAVRRAEHEEEIGRDRYGLWMDVEIAGVTQRMRWIPPGRFWMGSPGDEPGRQENEGPLHEVIVTRGYWMADTPVTQELWKAVMGGNPSEYQVVDVDDPAQRPVETVSWNDAQRFLGTLGESGVGFRLPREWEWEHACRAGTATSTWAGELKLSEDSAEDRALLDDIAWHSSNSARRTHPVKRKLPNPHGLFDLIGNVWEWCEDCSAPYTEETKRDPNLPREDIARVLRGGSWFDAAGGCRVAYRGGLKPSIRLDTTGFRFVRPQRKGQLAEPGDEPGPKPRDEAESPGSSARVARHARHQRRLR